VGLLAIRTRLGAHLLPAHFVCFGIGSVAEGQLREAEVAALIRGGLLTEETQNDTRAVKTAFYQFLDRTLGSMR